MALLENRITLSLEDLEGQLGATKLPIFVKKAEDAFLDRTQEIATYIMSQPQVKAIFVSGPTSSGKTTFTDRLAARLSESGKKALRISLDDYYNISELRYDMEGRPDYESLTTIDTQLASANIQILMSGESVKVPVFDFQKRERNAMLSSPRVQLEKDGFLLVEGLHGLSPEISGPIPRELWVGIFIMPWGEVVSDRRLIESQQVRLLRRIIRDVRHRGAHALATIDYWPMILSSEQMYFSEYLTRADFYVNSLLTYESMVIAPLARKDIKSALERYASDSLESSVFMKKSNPLKAYANLDAALVIARRLVHDLERIPSIDPMIVPSLSILNEFL